MYQPTYQLGDTSDSQYQRHFGSTKHTLAVGSAEAAGGDGGADAGGCPDAGEVEGV